MRATDSGDVSLVSPCFRGRGGEFAQDCVDEGSGGAFAGALYQFDTFVESGALRDAIEPEELIEGQAQGDENFEVEFRKRLGRGGRDFGVEARTPAEDSHDEFGGEGVICGGEIGVGGGVEEFGGVGGFAFDAEENVEGGGAGGGDGHFLSIVGFRKKNLNTEDTEDTEVNLAFRRAWGGSRG